MTMRKILSTTAIAAAALFAAAPAQAQEFYLGQILLVGFPYCPDGTVEASGQIMQVSQYQALYSIYGNQYGGTYPATFALPDLRGRRVVHTGQGPGLLPYPQAAKAGAEKMTLTTLQLPAHSHTGMVIASAAAPSTDNPAGAALADFPTGTPIYTGNLPPSVPMAGNTVLTDMTGSGQPFPLLDPYLVLRYCVVISGGLYPPRPD